MEEITLEKLDLIRERTGLSYADAKALLEKNNGNVVDALVDFEKNQKSFGQNVNDFSNDLVETIKDIINKGNVSRIRIKKDDKVLIDIPVTAGIAAGAVGLYFAPLLAIGAVAAVISKIIIEVERPDGKIEVINDLFKSKKEETTSCENEEATENKETENFENNDVDNAADNDKRD